MKIKFVIVGLLLSSCGSVYYAPNTQNVPLFQEKGDAKLSAGVSAGEDIERAFELQSAYAVTDHVGIMANFYRTRIAESSGTLYELGGGYFRPYMNHSIFEVYSGVSYAQVINSRNFTEYTDFTRYFIQPSVGYSRNTFEIAFSTRFAILNYHKIQFIGSSSSEVSSSFDHLVWNNRQMVIEPALTIRGGWKYIKLQTQVGLSYNPDSMFRQENLNLNVGAYFSISNRYNIVKE